MGKPCPSYLKLHPITPGVLAIYGHWGLWKMIFERWKLKGGCWWMEARQMSLKKNKRGGEEIPLSCMAPRIHKLFYFLSTVKELTVIEFSGVHHMWLRWLFVNCPKLALATYKKVTCCKNGGSFQSQLQKKSSLTFTSRYSLMHWMGPTLNANHPISILLTK